MSEEENLAKVEAGEDGDDGENGPAPVSNKGIYKSMSYSTFYWSQHTTFFSYMIV